MSLPTIHDTVGHVKDAIAQVVEHISESMENARSPQVKSSKKGTTKMPRTTKKSPVKRTATVKKRTAKPANGVRKSVEVRNLERQITRLQKALFSLSIKLASLAAFSRIAGLGKATKRPRTK
jgi:uncharacterized membrane protein (UPF0182 family)